MTGRLWLATTAIVALSATALLAQDPKQAPPIPTPAAPTAANQAVPTPSAAPSAEAMQAMMEAMQKAGTPGEAHKKLSPMVGTFDTKVTMFMPGMPPMQSTGTTVSKWVLDGRFIQQSFDGDFMGMPFHGIGFTGYDNTKAKYVGVWMDNMGTAMMTSTGTASGKSMKFTSVMENVMTGKPETITETVTVVDDDHHTMEMWGPGMDGKVAKQMEISYSRKK
jgi:Protein of unknown function (DUF1579)